ncbi:MAG: hypothetical protein K5750_06100 [Eubacterium sp.]|nr:hypothetical protein [Eubacterium sp.]
MINLKDDLLILGGLCIFAGMDYCRYARKATQMDETAKIVAEKAEIKWFRGRKNNKNK